MTPKVFFGYPEKPRGQAEVMRNFAKSLSADLGVEAQTWEDLQVDGRLVVSEVLRQIDESTMTVFDLTFPNPNVLFEVGYAIARGKSVWLTLDSTSAFADKAWRDLAILSEIGYTPYRNSSELIDRFKLQTPLLKLVPLYDSLIEGWLPDQDVAKDGLLYCTTFEPFEAANRLDAFVDGRQKLGVKVAVADPSESGSTPLRWFVEEMAQSAGVMIHFAGAERNRSLIHNNRHALVAGFALGMELPVLMLAESGFRSPFDFESAVTIYETSEECIETAREWLDNLTFRGARVAARRPQRSRLSELRFGEHVAENERSELPDYFVQTSAFGDVVASRDSIFVGHRGTGKTANALQAFDMVASNKTNLAVLIKPPGFEFPAMMALVRGMPEYQHDYFFDALWRFVIQTEIAATLLRRLLDRPSGVPLSADEKSFVEYSSEAPFDLKSDISVRLQQALTSLSATILEVEDGDMSRNFINEALHTQALAVLRSQLGKVLKGKKRVAVFVDNLDKGWERGTDFKVMARFILGLLSARGQVVTDFQKQDYWRDAIKLTVAVFLRSDIYTYLRSEAREPDKLPISTVAWNDWLSLRNVIESRYSFSSAYQGTTEDLWTDVFCPAVGEQTTQKFLEQLSLPRPRDLVFLCNSAVGRAVDRGHDRVEPEDFLSASETYSQYAYEALLVENGVTIPELETALLAFIDRPAIDTIEARRTDMEAAGLPRDDHERLLEKLVSVNFFGIETAQDVFAFPEVGSESAVAMKRAQSYEVDHGRARLRIHNAFHPFLGIREN
ncbi:P-loop ATPase, Sll1717 family [Microcella sp.]|uniref:P-loop ATPase, Sll1717 family n=1 Tax=Microcella sp. TaxID=1913979 RepID=UPI00391C553C